MPAHNIEKANEDLKLGLTAQEISYLTTYFTSIKRNPTDAELIMFAQVSSEHFRHKVFNAHWRVNGRRYSLQNQLNLFDMIKNTHVLYSGNVLSVYKDTAAVIGNPDDTFCFSPDPETNLYQHHPGEWDIVIKTETHNNETAIAPYSGAATGVGAEIRGAAAVGCGATTCAGLVGFSLSNLRIPHFIQPWEKDSLAPDDIISALDIIKEAPLGAASFSSAYGRPQIVGYFRTFEQQQFGYHKPIFISGGIGKIERKQIQKKTILPDAILVVLGRHINTLNSDMNNLQQSDPNMQRCCQEVINYCFQKNSANPILSIYDIGTEGLSLALVALMHQNNQGAFLDAQETPVNHWYNKIQEGYLLAIEKSNLTVFAAIAERECCPYVVIGHTQEEPNLIIKDHKNKILINLPLSMLLASPSETIKDAQIVENQSTPQLDTNLYEWQETAQRVLTLPCVASKQFLITIADRSVGGLVARDQMVGPWQVPVADVGVVAGNFQASVGSAMAMGERPFPALSNPKASVRLAITEAILNSAAASIEHLSDVKLSANWIAASGDLEQDTALYEGVSEAGMTFCANLGICIAAGGDALDMRTVWKKDQKNYENIAPLSLIVSAFSPVNDIQKTLTPELRLPNQLHA